MDERTYEQQVQDTTSYFYPSRVSQAQIEAERDADETMDWTPEAAAFEEMGWRLSGIEEA